MVLSVPHSSHTIDYTLRITLNVMKTKKNSVDLNLYDKSGSFALGWFSYIIEIRQVESHFRVGHCKFLKVLETSYISELITDKRKKYNGKTGIVAFFKTYQLSIEILVPPVHTQDCSVPTEYVSGVEWQEYHKPLSHQCYIWNAMQLF